MEEWRGGGVGASGAKEITFTGFISYTWEL